MPGGRALFTKPPSREGMSLPAPLHLPNKGQLPLGNLVLQAPKALPGLVEEAGSCFCCLKRKALQNGRQKNISHRHAYPSPSILYSPQTRLNLPPTMSGQRTGRQGRTACRHPRTLAEHAVHVRAFRATQTPTRGCCQCKGTAQKGRVGSPLPGYKPEVHLFMETGAGCFECRAGARTSSLWSH